MLLTFCDYKGYHNIVKAFFFMDFNIIPISYKLFSSWFLIIPDITSNTLQPKIVGDRKI